MKWNKTALLEFRGPNEQSVFGNVRELELQSLRNPESGAGDQRQCCPKRSRLYRSPRCELRGRLQETIDFVMSKNVTGTAPPWRVAENIDWRHLMSFVFRIERTCQTADGEQTIIALPDRRSAFRPLQNCIRLDELLRPAFGEGGETVEHVFLDFVLEPHAPVQFDVAINSIA